MNCVSKLNNLFHVTGLWLRLSVTDRQSFKFEMENRCDQCNSTVKLHKKCFLKMLIQKIFHIIFCHQIWATRFIYLPKHWWEWEHKSSFAFIVKDLRVVLMIHLKTTEQLSCSDPAHCPSLNLNHIIFQFGMQSAVNHSCTSQCWNRAEKRLQSFKTIQAYIFQAVCFWQAISLLLLLSKYCNLSRPRH